jgi:hypothetical protein
MNPPTAQNIERHIRVLTEDIGVRLAGSAQERQAADYVADQFGKTGAQVQIEDVSVQERVVQEECLEVCINGSWQRSSCSLLSNALGTDGRTLEAPPVFFACETDYQRKDLSCLSGKAVVHLGSHIESADQYRRLVQAKPAFVLFVDVRYPGTVATSDGMFPSYVHAYGALPIVSVAFMDAWSWQEKQVSSIRLRVTGGMQPAMSPNVIADLPGTDPDAGILLTAGHHDTQADSVGADDNATGVAVVLELARTLSRVPRKRTIRLISFGAEEQLSAGSAAYARQHRAELTRSGQFMLNFDACGSRLGWTELFCCGPDCMAQYLNRFFVDQAEYIKLTPEVIPYSDHFPFTACGIPSAWVTRMNCTSGRFFHHRPDDTLDRVSPEKLANLSVISHHILAQMATANAPEFPDRIPDTAQKEVDRKWQELFGGWQGFSSP